MTVLCYGTMVHVAEAAAEESGVDAEIVDLRSLIPLDVDAIQASVEKTGRCVIVHEATLTSGFGAELAAQVAERCFYSLEAPIQRVAGWDTPYPLAEEWDYFPGPERVGARARQSDGGVTHGRALDPACLTSAKASPRPRSSNGRSRSATSCARTRSSPR